MTRRACRPWSAHTRLNPLRLSPMGLDRLAARVRRKSCSSRLDRSVLAWMTMVMTVWASLCIRSSGPVLFALLTKCRALCQELDKLLSVFVLLL